MKPHTYPVTTAYVYHKTATRWRYHRIRIPSPPHTHAIKPQPVGVSTVTGNGFTATRERFHRNSRKFPPYQGSVPTVPRSRFHRTKVPFSPHTYTVKRLAQNERPDRGKRLRQRSKGSSPVRRPQRGRRAGEWERPIISRLRPLWGSYKYEMSRCFPGVPRPLRGLNPGLLPCDAYGISLPLSG